MNENIEYGEAGEKTNLQAIQMPAPTLWPLVMAFGLLGIFGGVTLRIAWPIYLGAAIAFVAAFGWWRKVIPAEEHEMVPVDAGHRPAGIVAGERSVIHLQAGEGKHRVRVPEEIHPYSAGIKGGLAGAAVMAVLACAYGLIAQHSLWYPINLLAGVVMPRVSHETAAQLQAFDPLAFGAAVFGHLVISMLVGVLYAVALPMFPKFAALWAGVVMPIIWSGLVAALLNLLNPSLNEHISWPWFVACQLGFGLVGGYVIARSTSIQTMQTWSLAERAFVEAPGVSREDN